MGQQPLMRLLHHLLALAVMLQLLLGFGMDSLFAPLDESFFITLHKSLGFTSLWLVLALALGRLITPGRPYPATMPAWQQNLARLTHLGLCLSVLTMSLSGYLAATLFHSTWQLYFLFPMPAWLPENPALGSSIFQVHIYTAWVIPGLVLLHLSGAIYHMANRDGILRR